MTYNLCPVSKQIAFLVGHAIFSVSRRLQLQLPGTDVAQLSQNMSGDSPVKSHQAPLHAKSEAWLSRGKLDYCCKLSQSS